VGERKTNTFGEQKKIIYARLSDWIIDLNSRR